MAALCHAWRLVPRVAHDNRAAPAGARATRGLTWHALPLPRHMPHVACTLYAPPLPGAGARATRGTYAAPSAECLAHVPRVARTPRAPPGACAARGTYAALSAWRMHVPRVARTPRAPPPAWRTCHFSPHAPPLALLLCHAWPHAARAARVSRVAHGDNTSYHAWYMREKKRCHTWHGISNSCATRG